MQLERQTTRHAVPCDTSNRTQKGEQLLLVLACLVRGGVQPENRDEDSHLIFGLNLKRIKLIYSIHQVPSISLHIITNFFLMVLICCYSFLTTCSLLGLLPSTLPSHHSSKTVSGKIHQGTNQPIAGQILWPIPILICLHNSAELCAMNTSPGPFAPLGVLTLFSPVLQSCCPFTSSYSTQLLNAGVRVGRAHDS